MSSEPFSDAGRDPDSIRFELGYVKAFVAECEQADEALTRAFHVVAEMPLSVIGLALVPELVPYVSIIQGASREAITELMDVQTTIGRMLELLHGRVRAMDAEAGETP